MTYTSSQDMATPHPLRQSYIPRPSSSSQANTTGSDPSSSIGSPFPPDHSDKIASPYASSFARTSTPAPKRGKLSRSNISGVVNDPRKSTSEVERSRRARSLKSSTDTGKENWQTPGEMSQSFSGDEISPEGSVDGELGNEKSVPLNDESMVSRMIIPQ